MSSTPLYGYPTQFGNKSVEVIDWDGPDYYFTGGVDFPVTDLGFGGFDFMVGSVSQSGDYIAYFRPTGNGANQTIQVLIVAAATGTEVAYGIDLSDEVFRLLFIMV